MDIETAVVTVLFIILFILVVSSIYQSFVELMIYALG